MGLIEFNHSSTVICSQDEVCFTILVVNLQAWHLYTSYPGSEIEKKATG